MLLRIVFITTLIALTLGCASDGKKKEKVAVDPKETAESLYTQGKKELDKENYSSAIEIYEKLESRYPFGPYALQAQLDTAFAHYKLEEPDAAIASADQFIRLQPQHPRVDYAYYIKGLANFNRGFGFMDRLFGKDSADVDVAPLRQAFTDFKLLVQRFPESPYAADAQQRLIYLRNELARHEFNIAKFYDRKKAYVAVTRRIENLIAQYDGAEIMPQALILLASAYDKLGLQQSYGETVRVLEVNFPDQVKKLKK